jgi:hypothetical protein
MSYCATHKQPIANITWTVSYKGSSCRSWNKECEIIKVPNMPMKIKSLSLARSSVNGWTIAIDTQTKVEYPISHSEIFKVIQEFGIPKGGVIENQWWAWKTISGKTKTLTLLIDDNN